MPRHTIDSVNFLYQLLSFQKKLKLYFRLQILLLFQVLEALEILPQPLHFESPANKLRNNYVIFRHFLVTNKRN